VYDQWRTDCPECSGQLAVVSFDLCANGKHVDTNATLHSDGFEVDSPYPDLKDQSTENEMVRCRVCGKEYTLDELSLEDA
jgi:uncharacterized protein YbaR (Trm112 family)